MQELQLDDTLELHLALARHELWAAPTRCRQREPRCGVRQGSGLRTASLAGAPLPLAPPPLPPALLHAPRHPPLPAK